VRFGGGGEACVRGWREEGDPGARLGLFFFVLLLFSIFENLFSYLVRFDLFETKKGDPLCVPFRLPLFYDFIIVLLIFDSFAHLIPY
jgi:hypothetical protein